MKKLFLILFSVIIVLNFAACSSDSDVADNQENTQMENNIESTDTSDILDTNGSDDNLQNPAAEGSSDDASLSAEDKNTGSVSDTANSETAKPQTSKPNASKPNASTPNTSKPNTSNPETAKPEVSKPDNNTGSNGGSTTPTTPSLSDMMTNMLANVSELPMVGNTTIDSSNFQAFLFIDEIEGAEALASEAMIGSVAHSVVLLRVPDGTDAAAVAADIKDNANPRKWICVEAEKVEVVRHDNVILLCMSFESTCDEIVAGFNSLF